jgi:hypothetical protein
MSLLVRTQFFRVCLALLTVVSAFLIGCYGVLLLAEVFDGRGSPGGNFLLFGLAIFFLCVSVIVLLVGLRRMASGRPHLTENSKRIQ